MTNLRAIPPIAVTALALVLTGCGAQQSSAPAPDQTSSASAAAPTTAAAQTAAVAPSTAEASEQASASSNDAGGSPSAEGSAEDGEQSAAPAGVGGTWIATSYGRSPAIQVTFDADQVSSSSLLVDLGSAVSQLP